MIKTFLSTKPHALFLARVGRVYKTILFAKKPNKENNKNRPPTTIATGGGEVYKRIATDILGISGMGKGMESCMKGDLRGRERTRDERKEEENMLQNTHQLQEVGKYTL